MSSTWNGRELPIGDRSYERRIMAQIPKKPKTVEKRKTQRREVEYRKRKTHKAGVERTK
jgi:hypothetical protein